MREPELHDLHPVGKGRVFAWPFRGDGFTTSGIWVEHDARLYPMYARVLAVNPNQSEAISVGDVIRMRMGAYDWVHLDDGRSFISIHESNIEALLDGYDEAELPERHVA